MKDSGVDELLGSFKAEVPNSSGSTAHCWWWWKAERMIVCACPLLVQMELRALAHYLRGPDPNGHGLVPGYRPGGW